MIASNVIYLPKAPHVPVVQKRRGGRLPKSVPDLDAIRRQREKTRWLDTGDLRTSPGTLRYLQLQEAVRILERLPDHLLSYALAEILDLRDRTE